MKGNAQFSTVKSQLPKGWEIKKLGEVCEIRSGRDYKKIIVHNGKYPIIGSAGKPMGYTNQFICEAGTTIIGRKGTINSPMFIETNFWNVDTAFGFHALDVIEKRYLFLFCLFFDFTKLDKGSGRPSLVKKDLKEIQIPIPPLAEQQRIVAKLDALFAKIQALETKTKQNLENAKELFKSYLQGVFENKGNNWEEKLLKDIAIVFGRGKSKHRPRNWEGLYGGNYPFIQTGDVRNSDKYVSSFAKSYNEIGLKQSKLWKKGTICITIAANIAETAILNMDACFPDSIIGLEVDPKKANLDFIYYLLQYFKTELQKLGKGSAQDNINLGTFENQLFPIPKSVDVQKQIVEKLDTLSAETKKLEAIYQEKLVLLAELKKSILDKAFKGELL